MSSVPSNGTHPDHHVMNDIMTTNQNAASSSSASMGPSSDNVSVQQSSTPPSPPAAAEGSDSSNGVNTNLYITGIPRHYQLKELHDLFAPFGPIVNSRLLSDRHTNGNAHRGVAFVRFASIESCQNAIHQLSGKVYGDEPLMIKFANEHNRDQDRSFDQRGGVGGGGMMAGGWMGNATTPFGMYDRQFGMDRGFRGGGRGGRGGRGGGRGGGGAGFQSMYPQRGMAMAQPYAYPSYGPPAARMPSYGYAAPTAQRGADGYALFVFHLPPTVTDSDLQQLFQLHGTVTAATVMRDPATGSSKGYGFVSMLKYEDAVRAIQMLNGFALGNKFLKVSFKKSNNKDGGRGNRSMVNAQGGFSSAALQPMGGYDRATINGGSEDLSAQFAAMQLQKQNAINAMHDNSAPNPDRY